MGIAGPPEAGARFFAKPAGLDRGSKKTRNGAERIGRRGGKGNPRRAPGRAAERASPRAFPFPRTVPVSKNAREYKKRPRRRKSARLETVSAGPAGCRLDHGQRPRFVRSDPFSPAFPWPRPAGAGKLPSPAPSRAPSPRGLPVGLSGGARPCPLSCHRALFGVGMPLVAGPCARPFSLALSLSGSGFSSRRSEQGHACMRAVPDRGLYCGVF